MSLFDSKPLTDKDVRKHNKPDDIMVRDKKNRIIRRRPYWKDYGKGPDGTRCKDCAHIGYVEFSKRYYKCGRVPISHGPGTQIATTDIACSFLEEK